MTTTNTFEEALEIVRANARIKNRIAALNAAGFTTDIRPMGSGGIGNVKTVNGETRLQVSYGWGKWNYAHVVIL
jgi:putative component of toxin-antitoxin plasmid stabilization module